jgi:hypothetical protein
VDDTISLMNDTDKSLSDADESWLETIEGDAPVLLIAPHGGRAGPATRALLNPKVNDLHTAEITRELAALLNASALINAGMDRNQLDLNRLSQVSADAPWFLETILRRVEEIIARDGHATVLLIHGWNVIQPRIDLGVGLRSHANELRPPGAARVAACDEFINGALCNLVERLAAQGILGSFGLRYPGGGAQNLLQAFTDRHLTSENPTLRQLSSITESGAIDAVQLELSVALRMPGELRKKCIATIAEVFAPRTRSIPKSSLVVIRSPLPKPSPLSRPVAPAVPTRVGIELFDPVEKIGAMASFDLGAGAMGARIMVLLPEGRVALFTGEGRSKREGSRVSLGPLALESDHGELILTFRGAAVIVPDATHYLSIERALASGWLDESMNLEISLRPRIENDAFDLEPLFVPAEGTQREAATFGRLSGSAHIDGVTSKISGFGRSGLSFTGIGPQRFIKRRMIWACFSDLSAPTAVELRAISSDDGEHRNGRVLIDGRWTDCEVESLQVEAPAVSAPPVLLSGRFTNAEFPGKSLTGEVDNFIPLSRPGPDKNRIFTALGFARFQLGPHEGGGMFECSRRTNEIPGSNDEDETDD